MSACGDGKGESDGSVPAPEERVLHIYNWADFIGNSTIAVFEARTGIEVVYDTYDSAELLETKLLAGRTGYDVVFPSAANLERQIKVGVFQKLDKSKLPNLANMDPYIMRQVAINDPGNEHSISYTWGTTGIGYNPDKVKKALGTDKIESWGAIFDPAIASRLAKCGITLLDAPEDVIFAALIYLGRDPNSEKAEDLAAAEKLLKAVRPYVRYFHSSQHVNDLASGEICVSLTWGGVIHLARSRAAAAASPVELNYVIPDEGANIYFDTVAIPADAPHPDNAHAFLNFLMEPEVIAEISNEIGYPNGNAASLPFVSEELRSDPSAYPDDKTMRKLQVFRVHSQNFSRDLNRAWTRIKTGQ